MVGSPLDSAGRKRRAPRGTVCVQCRQNKFRCDSREKYPGPCTKCKSANKPCSIDSSFQRIRRRGRIEQLEKELASLQGSDIPEHLNSPDIHESAHQPYLISPEAFDSSSPRINDASGVHGVAFSERQQPNELACPPAAYVLEDVRLEHAKFLEFLDEFYVHYHPKLPFLGDKDSILAHTRGCNLLLWAVVNAAARSDAEYHDLRVRMSWPIRRLALESAMKSQLDLVLIQALLLLCLWAPVYTSQADDPSSMLCGIACQRAMQMGLHRSGFDHEFINERGLNPEVRNARRKTWLACYVVNERLSMKFGVPATIQADHSILAAFSDYSVASQTPPVLRDQVEVVVKSQAIATLLGNNKSSPDGLHPDRIPIIEAFDDELSQLQRERSGTWTPELHALFQDTTLRLYLYALMPSTQEISRPTVLYYALKARSAAVKIVHALIPRGHASTDMSAPTLGTVATEGGIAGGFPAEFAHSIDYVINTLAIASCTMIFVTQLRRALQSPQADNPVPPEVSDADKETFALIRDVSRLSGSLSSIEYDVFHRVSEVLAYLVSASEAPLAPNTTTTATTTSTTTTTPTPLPSRGLPRMRPIRSRMGANLICQVLLQAQQRWLTEGWQRGILQLPDTASSNTGSSNTSTTGVESRDKPRSNRPERLQGQNMAEVPPPWGLEPLSYQLNGVDGSEMAEASYGQNNFPTTGWDFSSNLPSFIDNLFF